ncbi:MAG: gamma-glutamylcyclotransferase family protein [Variovorax sp.]
MHRPRASDRSARHVFVYGTLRAGCSNDIRRMRPAPLFIGRAHIDGTLFDFGSYPGLRLGAGAVVLGEVYEIDSTLEASLDRLEEVEPDGSGEYLKRALDVHVEGQYLRCLVYEIHPGRIGKQTVITSGDWVRHCAGAKP